jgi:regulator of protease activity HflC (stomatin/prohibitin superfamily)
MATTTVMDWQRGVLFTKGRFNAVLTPGRYRFFRRSNRIHVLDVRRRNTVVPGQELLTSDGITLRVSVSALWSITDPLAYLTGSTDPEQALYTQVQLAVRDAVAAAGFDQALADRGQLSAGLREAVLSGAAIDELGLELHSVAIKDLMLPAELRRATAETLLAREHGRAELERARAEAASLRALANTGRLLQEHPALLQLRTIQAAATPGSTIVLTTDRTRPATLPTPPG